MLTDHSWSMGVDSTLPVQDVYVMLDFHLLAC